MKDYIRISLNLGRSGGGLKWWNFFLASLEKVEPILLNLVSAKSGFSKLIELLKPKLLEV